MRMSFFGKLFRNKPISLLDLGFADAKRLTALSARHPKKRFAGIETAKRNDLAKRPNLKLHWGDAVGKLKRMRSGSVKIVTADFLFSELKTRGPSAGDLGEMLDKAGIRLTEGMLGDYYKKRTAIVEQVRRVLVPKGRFVVIEYSANAGIIKRVLENSGFNCRTFPVPEAEMEKTEILTLVKDLLITNPEQAESILPMKIVARKRVVQ